jgi:hypothetical protein
MQTPPPPTVYIISLMFLRENGAARPRGDQLDEEECAEQHRTVRQRRRQRLPGRAPPFVNTLAMGVRRCYAMLTVWRRLAFTKCGRPHATG